MWKRCFLSHPNEPRCLLISSNRPRRLSCLQLPLSLANSDRISFLLSVHKVCRHVRRSCLQTYHSLCINDFMHKVCRHVRRSFIVQLCESRGGHPGVRPNEPSGFRGRRAILNHASALVSAQLVPNMSTDIRGH